MKRIVYLMLLTIGLFCFYCPAHTAQKIYPYRLVYIPGKALEDMDQVELVRSIAKTCSERGLNGIAFSGFFDRLDLEPTYNFKNLREIQRICEKYNVELIPAIMGVGYNAPILAHDKNLAEGLPVKDALFVVEKGQANVVPDPAVKVANGGFEEYQGDKVTGFEYKVKPSAQAFLDNKVFKEGKAALRFEKLDSLGEEASLVTQEVAVHPRRLYQVSCWVKVEGIKSPGDVFPMLVRGTDGRRLQFYIPPLPAEGEWRKAVIGFNSVNYDKVTISLGVPGDRNGKFWIDGLKIEEAGLINVLRRPGTPLVVKGEKDGAVYEEGKDFAPVRDPVMSLLFDHDWPSIKILPGGRIKDGDRLRVSWYHPLAIYNGQTPVCMSEPKVYEIWSNIALLIHEYLKPKKYYLGTDELRMAGSCEACKKRGMTVSQILGDCVTRQEQIIRKLNPEAELLIWSDMFDPNHNALGYQGKYYYHVDETFDNSWKYVPKDLIMVCWYHEVRDKSLAFFDSQGFRTIGSSSGDLNVARGWLESLDKTPKACGIMYTTWGADYKILPEFGDLVNRKK